MTPPPTFFCTMSFDAAGLPGQWVRLRDAQAAAYAADGYARSSGRPGFVVTLGLADALKAASGLLTSWGDKLPVVSVTLLKDSDCDQVRAAMNTVTRSQLVVSSDAQVGPRLSMLLRAVAAYPLHLLVSPPVTLAPLILQLQEVPATLSAPSLPVPDSLAPAWERITRAKKPVIVLGRGGAMAIAPGEVATLATRLDAPVLLTASATTMPPGRLDEFRAAFADDGALVPSGSMVWVKAFATSDCIIALGSGLSEVDWMGLRDLRISRARIIQVDTREAVPNIHQTHVRMDAAAFVSHALESLRDARSPRAIPKWRRASDTWQRNIAREAEKCAHLDYIEPRFAAHEIVSHAPDDALFLSEGGACGMWVWSYLWLRPLVFPVQNGTIGVPLPMALGAHAAHPSRPLWCVIGDGAFFYTAAELMTLRDSGAPVVVFVFNDGAWSSIRLGQMLLLRGHYVGTSLPATNYADIAAAYGCETLSARTPDEMRAAVERARAHRGPAPLVIDVHLPINHVPYAGTNFVLAELDGALKTLAPASALSAPLAIARGHLPLRTIRSLIAIGR